MANLYAFQITEEFEEVPVQSRGFGILDVGYRSEVTIFSLIGGVRIIFKTWMTITW